MTKIFKGTNLADFIRGTRGDDEIWGYAGQR
ncbi:hypothetical protein [Sinorhizobium medicae]